MENRDGDMVRDMTYRRRNSNTESMENSISNAIELEASESRVRHGVIIITIMTHIQMV